MTYFITTKTSAHVDGSKYRVLSASEKREVARDLAANLNGTVRTQAELDKLIAADRLDLTTLPGYVAPEPAPTLVAVAKEIKTSRHARRTLGAKEKAAKRVVTPEVVLEAAVTHARNQIANGVARVALVRSLAGWTFQDGVQRLQRRDMFFVLHEVGAEVKDSTIATQFQAMRAAMRVCPA